MLGKDRLACKDLGFVPRKISLEGKGRRTMVLLYLPCVVISWLWLGNGIATVAASPIAILGCNDTCGRVAIPYPFGIGTGCYMDKSFEVYCNRSFSIPRPYLKSINMELLEVSLRGYARISNLVISTNRNNISVSSVTGANLSGSPFIFSDEYNRFTATGCNNYAWFFKNETSDTAVGCLSVCSGLDPKGCYGDGCCQTTIPPHFDSYGVYMGQILDYDFIKDQWKTAAMVDQSWLDSKKEQNIGDLFRNLTHVPAVVQWGKYQGYCRITKQGSPAFCSGDGYCWQLVDSSHLCVCSSSKWTDEAQLSDSYISSRCPEGEKYCTYNPKKYSCRLLCTNNPGPTGSNCLCPDGYYSYDSYEDTCYDDGFPLTSSSNRAKVIIIGCVSGFGSLLFLLGPWWLYKIIKRRKESRLKQKYFKRNGGLLLQQQLSSLENTIEQTKVFTSKDLEKATDNYHTNRIVGEGAQGTVYKGMLTDGRIVAIKKSKLVDEPKLAEFINEVVILSQINHRNVIQLLGCCLETEVPLLVYEFIPNGTLFHHLHGKNDVFPITWEMRLQIGTEVANALSYLHSAAALPIYHRDIKSSNILLDEKYRAKVADFGISKSIAVDQTHVTTRVQRTFGYLDPEYFRSSQFTDKSDVYSFGVVIVELLTGQKPISTKRSTEERSLVNYFLHAMEDNRLFDILDPRVVKEGGQKEIDAVAKLASECLDLNGRKRPTMKMVAMQLETIRSMQETCSIVQQDHEGVYYTGNNNAIGLWDATPSSTTSSFNFTTSLHTNSN